MKKIIAGFFLLVSVAGCSKITPPTVVAPKQDQAASAVTTHVATIAEWTTALKSSYKQKNFLDEGDGVSKFTVSFEDKDRAKDVMSFGKRDEFRKLRIFRTDYSYKHSTALDTYVSILDGGRPVLILSPSYLGRSWIFMNKLSIMVDGELIFEREFEPRASDREIKGEGVVENYGLLATELEINALRKISSDSKVLIRLTGNKGYVNITVPNRGKMDAIGNFKGDIHTALVIYDAINKAIDGHIPPVL